VTVGRQANSKHTLTHTHIHTTKGRELEPDFLSYIWRRRVSDQRRVMRAATSYFSSHLLVRSRSKGPMDDESDDHEENPSCWQFSSHAIAEESRVRI